MAKRERKTEGEVAGCESEIKSVPLSFGKTAQKHRAGFVTFTGSYKKTEKSTFVIDIIEV